MSKLLILNNEFNKKILILLLIVFSVFSLQSKPKLFWRYGDNYSYSIKLDDKWKTDLDYAELMGFNYFFYYKESEESEYPESLIIINYFNQGNDINTLEEFVSFDIGKFMEIYPEFVFEKLEWSIATRQEIDYQIYFNYSKKGTVKQYIAYLKGEQPYFISISLQLDTYGINNNKKYINDFKKIIKNIQLLPVLMIENK